MMNAWNGDEKPAPLAYPAFNPDSSAVTFNDFFTDRQAETAPAHIFRLSGIDLIKAFGDALYTVLRDTDSVIFYLHEDKGGVAGLQIRR